MRHSFLRKKLDGYIIISILVFSIPSTVFVARHIQEVKQQTVLKCLPKPTCMVAAPFCYLVPPDIDCKPVTGVKKATTVIHDSCNDCFKKGLPYLCSNSKTTLTICEDTPFIKKGYKCIVCIR